MKTITRNIIEFIGSGLGASCDRGEIRDIEDKLNSDNDFYADIDGAEFRFIHTDVIWETYVETIKEITEDCYDIKAPDWLAIDWEETAENCYVDGYGHTFASYDGEELEYTFGEEDYYIFRTN